MISILARSGILVLVILAVFGIMWAAGHNFGMQQAVEFFPYTDTMTLEDGTIIRSSGVVVKVNEYEAAPNDRAMANLMSQVCQMYPEECSGDNWEISVRRMNPNGVEERYSYYSSIYEAGGPGSWVEYGYWTDEGYIVEYSYPAEWDEVVRIAKGSLDGFEPEGN